jgi:GNAT superfamily N-acetyltransferase
MIRRATAEDIPRIVAMGRRHHGMSAKNVAYDGDSMAATVASLIAAPGGECLVSSYGSIAGVITPQFFNAQTVVALEVWWHSFDGTGLVLLDALEAWAREGGAVELCITTLEAHRPKGATRVLTRRGFVPSHRVFTKEL